MILLAAASEGTGLSLSVGPHLKTDSSMKSEVFYWGDYLQPLDYTVLFQ